MTERLRAVLECASLSDYHVAVPQRTYTYLLDDIGEEFKAKPILMRLFEDAEDERPAPKQAQEPVEAPQPATEKKGFFSRLFGKK